MMLLNNSYNNLILIKQFNIHRKIFIKLWLPLLAKKSFAF